MGGFLNPATTIGGTVAAPGIPLSASPFTGLYQLTNGLGFSVSGVEYSSSDGLGFTFGRAPVVTNALSQIAGSPWAQVGVLTRSVTVSPNGRWVVGLNFNGSAYVYSQNTVTGNLTNVAGSPFATGGNGYDVKFTPDGRFIVICNQAAGLGDVTVYSINNVTGALTLVAVNNVGYATRTTSIKVIGGTMYIFVASQAAATPTIQTYTVNALGAIALVGTFTHVGADNIGDLCVTPDGRFLYASSVGGAPAGGISAWAVNQATGALTIIGYIGAVNTATSGLTCDDKNLWIVNANPLSTISTYAINSTNGSLTSSAPDIAYAGVAAIAVKRDSSFLYAVSINTGDISQYPIASTGTLGAVSTVAGVSPAYDLTITPDERFYYTAHGDNNVRGYSHYAAGAGLRLVTATYDPTGGAGGAFNVNGVLTVNGNAVLSTPALGGSAGKYLFSDGATESWHGVTQLTPAAMVANAAAITLDGSGTYISEVTGVLGATGMITATFTTPTNPTIGIFDNKTTGNFLLTAVTVPASSTFYLPRGRSMWYWNGATLEQIENLAAQMLGKSAVAVATPADVTEDILATINIPPLLPHDQIRIFAFFSANVNANSKIARVRLGGIGGAAYETLELATFQTASALTQISNRGAVNSQVGPNIVGFGFSANAPITSAINTGVPTTIVITGQKAVAGDVLTLEDYSVELLSDGT